MPFRLDLLRHGDAVPAAEGGDPARPLSAIGRRDVSRMAEEYARRRWRPDRVLSSPLRRAQETAEIFLARLGPTDLETVPELDPRLGDPHLVEALRRSAGTASHVLAIGHQPLLGLLAAALTGDSSIGFPPAGMAWLEFDGAIAPNEGRLVRSVVPSELR